MTPKNKSDSSVLTDKFLAEIPHTPGVYLMKGREGDILYVGKARDLRKRLASYRRPQHADHSKTTVLLEKVVVIDTILTNTEKEALILEASLIKKHRPRYNVILRDDKNYPFIKVTVSEKWPRILISRRRIKDGNRYFGPYSSSSAMQETLRLVKKLFPLRNCNGKTVKLRQRPCLNQQMGRCLAPCCGLAEPEEYRNNVARIISILSGQRRELGGWLETEMKQAANLLDYEKAALYRDRLQAFNKTLEKQVIAAGHYKDQDIFGLARNGPAAAISIIFVREGSINGHLSYHIPEPLGADDEILAEAIEQFYDEERQIPPEIILSDKIADQKLLEEWLEDLRGRKVLLKVPQRGSLMSLVEMARENGRQVFADQEKRDRSNRAVLQAVDKALKLGFIPAQIECLDISNIGGRQAVGSLICFTDGEPDKKNYRHYRIHSADGPDDYAMMREVLNRRFTSKSRKDLPALLLVDGGKGQLNIAAAVLKEHGLEKIVALASIAKDKNDKGERIYLPGRKNPLDLIARSPVLHFFMRIRDESHRFGITFHRRLRQKDTLKSGLDKISGIGPSRRSTLLKTFGSLKRIRGASVDELASTEGIGPELAKTIFAALHEV